MLKFHPTYFFLAVLLFIVELLIALFVHDDFVRPYFGDFLVVVLIYCFVKSFLEISVLKTAFSVLFFSFFIEWLQYLNFIKILGLHNSAIAKAVIGHSFSWIDIWFYTGGIFFVLLIEFGIKKVSG